MEQVLNENMDNELRRILSDLLVRSEADDSLLCDSGGYVLATEGSGTQDPFQMAALGAGVFGASRELARLLGEKEFNAVLHQGAHKNIFIRAVHADALLVVIFSRHASVGLVKLYVEPAVQEMRGLLMDETRQADDAAAAALHPLVLKQEGALFTAQT